jgi:hypothetical protein
VKVLNPVLYGRLRKAFGPVRVSNEGQELSARNAALYDGRPHMVFRSKGEYYQVNCPFCADTKHRLYVSYMYGQTHKSGRRLYFLVFCFNENCLSRSDNLEEFEDRLGDINHAFVHRGTEAPAEAKEVSLPGVCLPLSDLPARHRSRVYLESRGFDPDVLCRRFGLSYCESSRYSQASNRIIIPVYEAGVLKGWQARYIGDPDWKSAAVKTSGLIKYYSCPGAQFRSRCVYNFDAMREWQTGVVVEGPTDVFRFGSMAGCVFGNTVTEAQRRKLYSVFGLRTLVLMLDPEEFEKPRTRETVAFFRQRMGASFAAVRLPAGTDPGSLDRDWQKEYVRARAAEQGVRVVYKKVQ